MKVGDKVIVLDNVIEERRKLFFTNKEIDNDILLNSIGNIYEISYIDINIVGTSYQLKGMGYFNIPINSIITLKEYRKEKLKYILS
jgi:hypothetical protein